MPINEATSQIKGLYQDWTAFYKERRQSGADPEEMKRLGGIGSQIKGAYRMAQDVDPEAANQISSEAINEDDRSTLLLILDTLDYGRNLVAKHGLVNMLGLKEQLGHKDTVTTSDILGAMGMEEGWLRSGLGFVGDVATDPITYILPYARVLSSGKAIATKAGARILSPKGFEMYKGIRKTVMMEQGLATTDDIIAKGGEALSTQLSKTAHDRLSTLIDSGQVADDMFYSAGAYFHVPFTKMYKQMFSWQVPEKIVKRLGDIPEIEKWIGPASYHLQKWAQPFTTAFMRTPGAFHLKEKFVASTNYAYHLSVLDVNEALGRKVMKTLPVVGSEYEKIEKIFPTVEAATKSMGAYEKLKTLNIPKSLIEKGIVPEKNMLMKMPQFHDMAKDVGMDANDLYDVFKGYEKLGQQLMGTIEKAGGDINQFAGYYVPHLADIATAGDVLQKGKMSVINLTEARKFESLEAYESFIGEHGYISKLQLNPYQAWTAKLSSANKMLAAKEYMDGMVKGGFLQKVPVPKA